MDTLIFLALIPFALAGLIILVGLVVGITWFLAPILVFLVGLGLFLILHQNGQHPVFTESGIGVCLMMVGVFWLVSRFKKS